MIYEFIDYNEKIDASYKNLGALDGSYPRKLEWVVREIKSKDTTLVDICENKIFSKNAQSVLLEMDKILKECDQQAIHDKAEFVYHTSFFLPRRSGGNDSTSSNRGNVNFPKE